ncbi:MAG: NYN domain-containing protein [Myxococcales bacterium]|nr:NYN domain-containing protein [Myxococcales bacterium]
MKKLASRPQWTAGRFATRRSKDIPLATPGAPHSPSRTDARDESPRGLDPLPGAREWLVDGYNVLHCAPFRSSFADSEAKPTGQKPFWSNTMRERLVAFTRRFPDPHAEIWLVFDGSRAPEEPERGDHPKVTLQFAPSADDWIVKHVRGAPDPNTIAVVSGDRQLTGRVRHHGAAVVSPRLFLGHCAPTKS